MKAFRMLFRSVRDAFKSVVRNFSLSLASISCITITLIIIAVALMISQNVSNFTKEIKKDVTIVVFLKNDATKENREQFEKDLEEMENIDTFNFKSKETVKEEMEKQDTPLGNILSEWDDKDNPLRDTYTIKVLEVEKIGTTAKELEKIEFVYKIQYGEGLVEQMVGIFNTVEKVTIVAAGALIIVTVFLIINTIKLTIFSRRREISIMRLVGASNMRVKLPFIVEGIVLGIIGSIIPVIIVIYGYTSLYNQFGGHVFTPIIKLVRPMPFIFYTAGIILAVGMLVGMIGSARAVRRYVKG